MDLHSTWKQLESEKLTKGPFFRIEIGNTSRHPIEKLKNSYRISSVFIVIFLLAFLFLFIISSELLTKGIISSLLLYYAAGLFANLSMYKKLAAGPPVDQSILSALKDICHRVSTNVRFQERFGLFIYPVAGVAGFLLGYAFTRGSLNNVFTLKTMMIAIGTISFFTLVGYRLARRMNETAYGQYVRELKALILQIENEY